MRCITTQTLHGVAAINLVVHTGGSLLRRSDAQELGKCCGLAEALCGATLLLVDVIVLHACSCRF